jgi:hypothetical protein
MRNRDDAVATIYIELRRNQEPGVTKASRQDDIETCSTEIDAETGLFVPEITRSQEVNKF